MLYMLNSMHSAKYVERRANIPILFFLVYAFPLPSATFEKEAHTCVQ